MPQTSTIPLHTARLGAALVLGLSACVAPATGVVDHSTVEAHAQRPFLGRDTHTVDDSFFELEVGVANDPGEIRDLPLTIKYGLGPRSEFFVGLVPYHKVDKNELAPDGTGFGDTLVGLAHRFRDHDKRSPAYAFQVATKLPTARSSKGLGTGEIDFFGAIMAEQVYYGTTVAGSYQFGVLGETDGTGFDHEHILSLQGRRPVKPQVAVFGEMSFVWQPEVDREELSAMGGLSFIVDDFTLFDVGVRIGVSADAPDFQLLFGLTRTLGLLAFNEAGAIGR
ncbi:MAG: transporter [bacterium]|nr:hypothetical protein [Planctomycetota bacterium]HIL51761.1 hypothetical protein [Planctomycetota bacterium]